MPLDFNQNYNSVSCFIYHR